MPLTQPKQLLQLVRFQLAVDDVAHPPLLFDSTISYNCLHVSWIEPLAFVTQFLEGDDDDIYVEITSKNVFVGVEEALG